MSCEPQRGCSFGAGLPPFSYVPIEMCSAPWYAARSGPRSASAAGRKATPAAAISRVPGRQPRAPQRPRGHGRTEDRSEHARPLEREARLRKRAPHRRQQRERLGEDERAAQDRHALRAPPGRGAACGRTRRAARRRRRAPRIPTTSARARARRSGAPCLRAGRFLGHAQTLAARTLRSACLQRVRRRPTSERVSVDLDERHDLADGRGRERLLGSEQPPTAGTCPPRRGTRTPARARSSVARVTPARIPRSSDGVKSVSPTRHQTFVTVPSRTIAVGVDEERLVDAAPPRLGLGGHVHGVARRLHAREEPRRRRAHAEQARPPSRRARASSSIQSGTSLRSASAEGMPPAGPAVQTRRSDASPPAAFGRTSPTSTCRRRRSTAGQPDARCRRRQPIEVRLEPERAAAVHAERLECGAAAQERLVVRADDGLRRDRRGLGPSPRGRARS